MKNLLKTQISKLLPCLTKEIVINNCVHFGGFRYGHDDYNPYETYLLKLVKGYPISYIRNEFIEFLKCYRPKNIGEALGIKLSKDYPLWIFPWKRFRKSNFYSQKGWYQEINLIPDIITHYSYKGIPFHRIEEEFLWLERSLQSINKCGYLPEKYGYIEAIELLKNDNSSAYILTDGNHRVSALSALGIQEKILIKIKINNIIKECDNNRWFGVKKRYYKNEDALLIFNSYFLGNKNYVTSSIPARIIHI